MLSPREICCHGFSPPPITPTIHNSLQSNRHRHHRHNLFPTRLEDWDRCNVEDWLSEMGFGRYSPVFASDYGGIGVDGDRLVYLGTEDQLDHIEYQLSLIGVADESDQIVLGSTIIELVAASEVTPELLESMARMVPAENRDAKEDEEEEDDDKIEFDCGKQPDYEI